MAWGWANIPQTRYKDEKLKVTHIKIKYFFSSKTIPLGEWKGKSRQGKKFEICISTQMLNLEYTLFF